MSGLPSRDLAVMDPWEASYTRSRARRRRASSRRSLLRVRRADAAASHPPASLSALLDATGKDAKLRDLADTHMWELSLGRSRARRRAQQLRFVPSGPGAKRISLGALVALAAAPSASMAEGGGDGGATPPAGPPTTTEHTIMLSEGSEGRQVRLLQQALGGIKVDGVFGPETEEAVLGFQSSRDLTVDGVVGPQTGAALREQTTATATLASFKQPVPGEAAPADSSSAAAAAAAQLASSAGAGDSQAESEAPLDAGAQSESGAVTGGVQPEAGAQDGTEDKTEALAAGGTAPEDGTGRVNGAATPVSDIQASSGTETEEGGEGTATWDAVTRLQAALHLPVDGDLGPETEAAIMRLQARHGLTVDGVVGPATWNAIGVSDEQTLTPSQSTVAEAAAQEHANRDAAGNAGANGADPNATPSPGGETPGAQNAPAGEGSMWDSVTRLQAALHLPVDGEFGPETEAAIMRLQARHGLTADGVVGPDTWALLGVSGERTLTPPPSALIGAGNAERNTSSAGGSGEAGDTTSAGGGEGVVARVIAAADEIATRPYVYGGGHGSFQSEGYDCSGSVSYALHGGGLLSSPEDSTALESYGEPGPGKYITIYANSEHAYMVIDGKRYDTVALAEDGSRWGGPSSDGGSFVERHPAGL
jgi:peptidoglycan hydrolase-like protein with peptidoglycan-binding domain